jgi:tetratricopeptide (TPR) repeat protein
VDQEKILALASRELDRADYRKALELLLSIKDKMTSSAPYHDLLGVTYFRLDQPIPAIEALQKAVHLDPRNENYYLDLGQVLQEYEAHEPALEFFRAGISILPQSARLHTGIALAYHAAGRAEDARTAAEKAIRIDPMLETAYTTLALIDETQKNWAAVLSTAEKLRKLNPKNYLAWYYLGLARTSLQRDQPADSSQDILAFRKAIELNPAFPLAHFQLAKLYSDQGNHAAAIKELDRAVQVKPDYVEAHFLLAMAHNKLGNAERARQELEIHQKLLAAEETKRRPHLEVKIVRPN